jgi:acetoin utilization protein AcuB
MQVDFHMSKNLILVQDDSTIAEAMELMRDNGISRLPVVSKAQLVGIVTDRDLSEVSPSPATSLSVFEINYLLSKTKIKDIMSKNVVTVEADALIEEAAVLMRDNDIGGLPVLKEGRLCGIITESDIFDAFIEIMGFREYGGRINVNNAEDKPHVLANIAGIIGDMNINIINVVVMRDGEFPQISFRLPKGVDVESLANTLKEKGYEVESCYTYESA